MRRPIEDFVERIPFSGCWIWMGGMCQNGYGFTRDDDRSRKLAHRAMYEKFVGQIKPGLQIDHLCRNRACVNPQHLEAVTPRENVVRGNGPKMLSAWHRAKTHCPQGHEYAGDNLYIRPGGGRSCRACRKAAFDAFQRRKANRAA